MIFSIVVSIFIYFILSSLFEDSIIFNTLNNTSVFGVDIYRFSPLVSTSNIIGLPSNSIIAAISSNRISYVLLPP